jgi:antitoxin HicB
MDTAGNSASSSQSWLPLARARPSAPLGEVDTMGAKVLVQEIAKAHGRAALWSSLAVLQAEISSWRFLFTATRRPARLPGCELSWLLVLCYCYFWVFLDFRRSIMKYRILIEQDEDGMFVAECPSLPGCISQGRDRNEAVRNIQDAIRGYLESLKKRNEPIPPSIEEEIVEVAM